MGLFSVLQVGTRGMSAAQLGMDITGQNISNADVEGYSRKRLNTAADYRQDPQFGQMGFGVTVISIERIRNTYIDQQIRRQNQEVGAYEEIDHTLESIENILIEPGETGLMNFVADFFDNWENLASNPTDMAARTMVRTSAEVLTDVFHNISGELRDLRQTRNDEIGARVQKVNKLCHEVYNLNHEISAVEISNQNANDSRDRRDQVLKELSKLIDLETVENDRGQVTVMTMGNILVSPVDVQDLELTTSLFTRADGTKYHDVGIRFGNSKREYRPTGGQIKGLLDSRNIIIPEYEAWLDSTAVGIVQQVNSQHVVGYNLMGYSGINFFDTQVTGASDIAVSAAIASNVQNIAAAQGGQTRLGGTNVMPAGALDYGSATSPAQIGQSAFGDPSNARNLSQGTVVVRVAGTALTENVDYHIDYVNGTIQMLHNGFDGNAVSVDFNYNTGGFNGPGDNSNAVAISDLRHQLTMAPDALGNPTNTFDQYYGSFIGRLGFNRSAAESNLETRQYLVEQYETQQDAIAGVSLDEEMAELIKFEHTYQAAARIITTADKMLEVLLNM